MLTQISQYNQKHVNHRMGVFVIQQKLQLIKAWASVPSCSVRLTSTLTAHKVVVGMSSMHTLIVDLICYWVVLLSWQEWREVMVKSTTTDCQKILSVDCTVC